MKTLLLSLPIALLFASCGGAPDTPADVVEAYLQAAVEHDTDTMRELLVKEEAAALEDLPEGGDGAGPGGEVNFAVGEATIEGDRATVRVTYTIGGGAEIHTDYVCRRVNGVWRLSLQDSSPVTSDQP